MSSEFWICEKTKDSVCAGVVNVKLLLQGDPLQTSPSPSACFPVQTLPLLCSSLSTHVLSSVSARQGRSDRKTWCVVISEAWQHGEGSYLGPLEKGLGTWWGPMG